MSDPGFLAVTPHAGPTRDLLAAAARRRGMDIVELVAPGTAVALRDRPGGHFYGGPGLGAAVADDLGVALLEPTDDWLPGLGREFTRRTIHATTLGEARGLEGPVFVKPPRDKTFPAAVYGSGEELPDGPDGPDELPILVSEVVDWAAEFRLFVLDGEIRTGAQYATYGHLEVGPLPHPVQDFASHLLAEHGDGLPSAVVVDVGLVDGAWAVVEANMPWFSTVYAADPARALEVTLRAAGPRAAVRERDRKFVRTPTA
ncbi:ATP-grasp domain-containing protein [Streptomyces solicathayae]|uniref:ATP-grasp domain-containing protein n=1 Tax=Streptomyces solicathayae TaxID=3081768 RepID=A0ABZ0LWE9_9ACTN|nr:ATP-grasp domain-containing protein [Streptomyces sp. HUAS YS2]WOX23830.1 ATP-grasp domain-containing protein [Streptomyces sp. HUAS YS2]